MGGSLACEPARLAGEWAGQFGKLARGKRGVDSGQWTMYEAYTQANDASVLYCCT